MIKDLVQLPSNGLTMVDLFCGAGVGAIGFKAAGYDLIYGFDNNRSAVRTYNKMIGNHAVAKNVRKLASADVPYGDVYQGGFPCFIAGTRILTENGYKNIEDIHPNEDRVLTGSGEFEKVINCQVSEYSGNLQKLRIKYNNKEIVCTPNHPFYARTKNGIPEFIHAKNLTRNHYVGFPININDRTKSIESTYYNNQFTKRTETINLLDVNHWYLMGYFLGDGWIEEHVAKSGKKSYKIRFAISDKDKDKVLPKLQKVLPITSKNVRSGKSEKYGCANKLWFDVLSEFGKYSHGKVIPQWVVDSPIEYLKYFVEGYIDSDGHREDSFTKISTVSNNIMLQMQQILAKLGIISSVSYRTRPFTNHSIEGREIKNERPSISISWFKNNDRYDLAFIDNGYMWFNVFQNETVESSIHIFVYNLEIRDFWTYCVENFIVHNCTSFSAGGAERGVLDEKNGDLGYHFARLVVDNQPKAFIAENVSGLAFPKHRAFLNTLLNTFSVGGYNVIWRLIDCYHYGVPQNRKRVFIVGIRKDLGLIFRFPAPISIFERTNLRDAIGDLPQPWEDHNFKNHKRFYNDGWAPRYCTTHRQRQWNEPSYTIVSVARQLPQYPEPPNYDIRKRHLYDCEPPRRFTVRECLRIQTVPDWFHFDDDDVRFDKQHERCSGIPPIVSYTLGVSLANQLKEERIKEKPLSLERKLAILQ